jgi:hypothetical protein
MDKKKKIFPISIYCAKCRTLLYEYQKEGKGSLVKCFTDRIVKNYTEGSLKCPNCNQAFARLTKIGGRPAHKIIQGKVFVKGHLKK